MKSRASIKGHPLHPILVSFPIVFFISAFGTDLVQWFTRDDLYNTAADILGKAGIISALVAAIPGMIDYFSVVPPESSAKKRGTKHAILNSSAVMIYLVVLFLRKEQASLALIVACEGVAIVLLTAAGWLGGTLVVRNQVGVDHRYANAGRWTEEHIRTDSSRVELKETEVLELNQMRLLHVNGQRIVVGRTENGLVAFDDHCTHRGGSLADGVLICSTVQCPWHGSQFDVASGKCKAGPAQQDIRTYHVMQENGKIFLQWETVAART